MYDYNQRRMLTMSVDEYRKINPDFSKFAESQYKRYLEIAEMMKIQSEKDQSCSSNILADRYSELALSWLSISKNSKYENFKDLLRQVLNLSSEVGVINPLCEFEFDEHK